MADQKMKDKMLNYLGRKAQGLRGNRGRVQAILTRVALKLHRHDVKEISEELGVMRRMLHAFVIGTYRSISWKSIAAVGAGLLYFVDPLDVVPDVIPVAGLVDDITVLLWVFSAVRKEVRRFLAWEATMA